MSQIPRKLAISCLVLVVTGGLALWLARDLPRQAVAAILENKLAARVRLDRFEIINSEHHRLGGLTIDKLRDYPFVESIRIERLEVEGALRGMLDTRFDRMRLVGVEARLAPAPAVEPPDKPLPIISELIVEPMKIRIAGGADGGGGDALVTVESVLTGVGESFAGDVRISTPELLPEALLALGGSASPPPWTGELKDLEATLQVESAGQKIVARAAHGSISLDDLTMASSQPQWNVDLGKDSVDLSWRAATAVATHPGGTAAVDRPSLDVVATRAASGWWKVEADPRLPWFASGRAVADWDPAARRLLRFAAHFEELDLERLLPDIGLTATADVELTSQGDQLVYTVDVAPVSLRGSSGHELVTSTGAKIRVAGSVPWEPLATLQTLVWVGPVRVDLDLPTAEGSWGSIEVPPSLFPLQARFDGNWQRLESLRADGDLQIQTGLVGQVQVDGEVVLASGEPSAELSWNWSGISLERSVELLREMGGELPGFNVTGLAEASGSLRGALAKPQLRAEARWTEVVAEAAHDAGSDELPRLVDSAGKARFSWADGDAAIHLGLLDATASLESPEQGLLPLVLQTAGWLRRDLRGGRIDQATLSSPGLGVATGQGRWRRGPAGVAATGDLTLQEVDLERWRQIVLPQAPSDADIDLELAGKVAAELAVELQEGGAWRLAGPAKLAAAGFTSGDGSRVMEGLEGEWQLSAHGAPAEPIEATARGQTGGFLLLWQTFFGDFSAVEATIDVTARWAPAALDGSRPWRIASRFELPQGPVAEAGLEGTSGSPGLRYVLSLDDADLETTHQQYLSTVLAEKFGRLDLAGALSAKVRGHFVPAEDDGPDLWDLAGRVTFDNFHLGSGGGQAEVVGLYLDLPLDLRRRPTGEVAYSGPRLGGRLAFERLGLRDLDLPPTDSVLWVEADSVGLENSIALDILGGAVTFEQLKLSQLMRPGRHLETAVRLSGIRLEQVAEALALFPLEGALDGYLPSARLSPDRLRVEGGGQVEIFGGTVKVRDISGEDVLTRFPKLKLSADFENIDLGQLTRRIDFGEMTGILAGSLEDCELFRGVPVRFDAHFETVHREGVSRKVDVKAINNLTILSTGQSSNVFDRGIQRFFKSYTYDRLGVSLKLDDDVLLMRGLEQRGEKELFLSGRLPFRIDVVNAEPGKTVSFQAMMRRLRSLDFSSATTQP